MKKISEKKCRELAAIPANDGAVFCGKFRAFMGPDGMEMVRVSDDHEPINFRADSPAIHVKKSDRLDKLLAVPDPK